MTIYQRVAEEIETSLNHVCAECLKVPGTCEQCVSDRNGVAAILEERFLGQQWIPVSERSPRPQQLVIVVVGGGTATGWLRNKPDKRGKWVVSGYVTDAVTHWQPLPAPPEVRAEFGKLEATK